MYSGVIAKVLSPVHRTGAYREGIFLNIFQSRHDHHLSYVARRMRTVRLIEKTYVNLSGLTIVYVDGRKKEIKRIEDLEQIAVAMGRSISEFSSDRDYDRNDMETN